ncbi:MAG: threonine ammonia-lyase [Gemmatimonadota bacterium]
MSDVLINAAAIEEAAKALAGVAIRTPLLPIEQVPGLAQGVAVWVKPESLQRGGSFKFRGAWNFLARLSPEERSRGVIAPSSGNHAQAVALAARLHGAQATVVMPTTVTPAKQAGASRLGARIELAGTTTKHRMDRATELAATEGLTLVPPYDHPWIIAGQGTAGLEIIEDMPDVDQILVPVGGGGLSSGVAAAAKLSRAKAQVIGAEPAGAPKLTAALQQGAPVTLESTRSIADGLMAVRIGDITFAHHRAFLDQVVTVPDEAIVEAMKLLLDRCKLVVEPSGAITLAALLAGAVKPDAGRRVVCILSGGNIEWSGLVELLQHG